MNKTIKFLFSVVVAGAVMLPGLARAQSQASCLGVANLHCGPAVSLLEWKPLSNQGLFSPGGGPELDYHFQKWDLGAALFLGGTFPIGNGQSGAETSVAVFGCLGPAFGPLQGVCAGPDLAVNGGLSHFTWKNSLGLVFNLSPDMLSLLSGL